MDNNYDEAVLLARLKANDFSAQKQLMLIYAPKLISFAMAFELSREDAEEVVSQSLQKVIEKIETYETNRGTKFSTWVFRITKNTIIDRLRQIQRKQEKSGGPLESIEKLEEEGYQFGKVVHFPLDDEGIEPEEIDYKILYQALDNLNPIDRKVLSEWAYSVSFKNIGQMINKKEETVKVRKHRALSKLRTEYLRILANQSGAVKEILKARYKAIGRELR